jgi:phosphopantetheinyl transferase (holo-ACP synthase)
MLGNDVIDLGDPETRPGARHPRFDARVFTREERAALALAADPERLRWSLWAAKEAAYKCLKKLAPGTCFSPVRFAVRLSVEGTGSVDFGGRRLRVAILSQGDALHAVATGGADPERTVLRVLSELPVTADSAGASEAVRALARDAAASQLGCAPGELELSREGRVPRLRRHGAKHALELSLSHHGRFLAAALEIHPGPGPT